MPVKPNFLYVVKPPLLQLVVLFLALTAFGQIAASDISASTHQRLDEMFSIAGVEGTFVLYDPGVF